MIKSRKSKKPAKHEQPLKIGYVYVATNELYESKNIYKIGFTTNIHSRTKSLSRDSLYNMYPVLIFIFEDSKKMEKKLHEEYAKWRIRENREYFYLDRWMLIELKNKYYDFLFADKEFIDDEWYKNGFFDVGKEAEAIWNNSFEYF